jgi:heme exporter protein D
MPDHGVPVWLFATAIAVAVLAALVIPALWRRRSTRATADRGDG